MCNRCGKDLQIIECHITDKNKTITLCPNCLCIFLYNDCGEEFENSDEYICDITGKRGAIRFKSGNEKYFLEKEIMLRLLKHNLKPDEYFALTEKYNENNNMLHDDFYYPDTGEAVQPMDC